MKINVRVKGNCQNPASLFLALLSLHTKEDTLLSRERECALGTGLSEIKISLASGEKPKSNYGLFATGNYSKIYVAEQSVMVGSIIDVVSVNSANFQKSFRYCSDKKAENYSEFLYNLITSKRTPNTLMYTDVNITGIGEVSMTIDPRIVPLLPFFASYIEYGTSSVSKYGKPITLLTSIEIVP